MRDREIKMYLRDQFAMAVLPGLAANANYPERVAKAAYEIADAMLGDVVDDASANAVALRLLDAMREAEMAEEERA